MRTTSIFSSKLRASTPAQGFVPIFHITPVYWMWASGLMAETARIAGKPLDQLLDQSWTLVRLTTRETEAVNEVVSIAAQFFQLPLTTKLQCQFGPSGGFRPYGVEYSKSEEQPDEMETFSITAASVKCLYPIDTAQHLASRSMATFDLLEGLAEALTRGLARSVTGNSWEAKLHGVLRQSSTLQINYAQPNKAKSVYTNEEHEDGHFLTLAFATEKGLEVRQRDGRFIPVHTGLGEVVAMLGETASLMTDGRLRPLFHQVRPPPDCPQRISVLFFADLAPNLCKPWIVGETNRSVDIPAFIRGIGRRFGLHERDAD